MSPSVSESEEEAASSAQVFRRRGCGFALEFALLLEVRFWCWVALAGTPDVADGRDRLSAQRFQQSERCASTFAPSWAEGQHGRHRLIGVIWCRFQDKHTSLYTDLPSVVHHLLVEFRTLFLLLFSAGRPRPIFKTSQQARCASRCSAV